MKKQTFAVLILFLAACSQPIELTATPEIQATDTEAAPTTAPTQEPTATEVEEFQVLDVQEALPVFLAREEAGDGCIPTYKTGSVNPLVVENALPWTVDSNGEPIQGAFNFNFCGDGFYIVFFEINSAHQSSLDSFEAMGSTGFKEDMLGPTYIVYGLSLDEVPDQFVGDLSLEGLAEMQHFYRCMTSGPEYEANYDPEKLKDPLRIEIVGENLMRDLHISISQNEMSTSEGCTR